MFRRLCVCVVSLLAAAPSSGADGDRLVSRPRPAAPVEKSLSVGARLATGPGESRRLLLPDRSLLFVRERTTVRLPAENTLEVSAGEVFVELSLGKLAPALVVQTPGRKVTARDSRFGVRAGEKGTAVVVATGSADVDGVVVRGGQMLAEKAEKPTAAPRLSHLVEWTRELRNAAPLVPASE